MFRLIAVALVLSIAQLPVTAHADVAHLASCQKKINAEGAKFAQKTIKSTLKCTAASDQCLINCEAGLYGPVCDDQGLPAGCCDAENPASNSDFQTCLAQAQAVCDAEAAKIVRWELDKQTHITSSCAPPLVSANEICNTNTPGLHFATVSAGCQAIIPGWVCNGLDSILQCVGGPLEKRLADQISGLLDPRGADSIPLLQPTTAAALGGFPIAQRKKGTLTGVLRADIWRIDGLIEGDVLTVRVETRDDTGLGQATILPRLVFLDSAGPSFPAVADTNIRAQTCDVPTTCGGTCPVFKRAVPRSGSFYLAVTSDTSLGCGGVGRYKLIVTAVGGVTPVLVGDEVSSIPLPTLVH